MSAHFDNVKNKIDTENYKKPANLRKVAILA